MVAFCFGEFGELGLPERSGIAIWDVEKESLRRLYEEESPGVTWSPCLFTADGASLILIVPRASARPAASNGWETPCGSANA
jgi:hypothetical protein